MRRKEWDKLKRMERLNEMEEAESLKNVSKDEEWKNLDVRNLIYSQCHRNTVGVSGAVI